MKLGQLMAGLPVTLRHGSVDAAVADLVDDSRRVTPGSAFVARPGAGGDGAAFVDDALQRGAAAVIQVLSDADPAVSGGEQGVVGALADRFFGEPSARIRCVGITGTKGKTTVGFLTQHLLNAAGLRCGLIGTVIVDEGGPNGPTPASLTTPGAIDMHRSLARMLANGCQAAAMEISSHALHQRRADAVRFQVGVFTNLTGDHLDYHGTMEAYADAKARLFALLQGDATAVLNVDSPWWKTMVPPRASIVGTTLQSTSTMPGAPAHAQIRDLSARGSEVRFVGPWGRVEVTIPLVGQHNVSNALQALTAAWLVSHADAQTLTDALRRCPLVPGRLEPVTVGAHGEPVVLVDYAHTDDALDKALTAVRGLAKGRVIVVFGCGGDRDRTKRPRMAQVACRLADQVVITSDNPRTEDAQRIIDEILAGVPDEARPRVQVEPDRAAAIELAIEQAGPADTVLIAGKGHEDYQILPDGRGGTRKVHFDDREQAAAVLRRLTPLQERRS